VVAVHTVAAVVARAADIAAVVAVHTVAAVASYREALVRLQRDQSVSCLHLVARRIADYQTFEWDLVHSYSQFFVHIR
jgi:hypothetical protein